MKKNKIKKIAFIIFSAITFYCQGQQKIILTTGDSLIGTIHTVDTEHSRIIKSDGSSILILSNMIIRKEDINPNYIWQEKIILSSGDTLIGTVHRIDSDRSRIIKSDGTSLLILSNMIISVFSMEADTAFSHENKYLIGYHFAPLGSMIYEFGKGGGAISAPAINFLAGINLKCFLKSKTAFVLEINYEQKGIRSVEADYIYKFTCRYLTLPLCFNFRLNNVHKKTAFYFNTGIYVGYLLSSTDVQISLNRNRQKKYYESPDINRFDWGLITGIGWHIPMKKGYQFLIEARNILGLGTLAKSNDSLINTSRVNFESFAMLFGVAYKI